MSVELQEQQEREPLAVAKVDPADLVAQEGTEILVAQEATRTRLEVRKQLLADHRAMETVVVGQLYFQATRPEVDILAMANPHNRCLFIQE